MREHPPVCVIVPTFNRCDMLLRCLGALARQTYEDYEVIVVDDGSTDGTRTLLESIPTRYPDMRFRWMANDKNIGATASRNRAIREAKGEFLAFLDSDCVASPDWLEHLVACFDGERVAAVAGLIHDPQPSNIYELALKGTSRIHGKNEARRLVACNLALRAEISRRFPFDEETRIYAEEEALQLRLQTAGYRLALARDAVVLHDHHYDRRSFYRRARLGGAAAAWLVYKFHLPPRLDLLPFVLAYLTLPVCLLNKWLLAIPGIFFVSGVMALLYNEVSRKGKSLPTALYVLPLILLFYQVRLASYVKRTVELFVKPNDIVRVRLGCAGGVPDRS